MKNQLSNIIETARVAQGFSKGSMCRACEIQQSHYNLFLKGEQKLGQQKIENLFEFLGLVVVSASTLPTLPKVEKTESVISPSKAENKQTGISNDPVKPYTISTTTPKINVSYFNHTK